MKKQVEAEQRRRQGSDRRLSADISRRIHEAFKELNDLYKQETGDHIDTGPNGPTPAVPAGIEFTERQIVLRQNRPRRVPLLVNLGVVPLGAPIILECDSNEIRLEPPEVTLADKHVREDPRIAGVSIFLSSDILGARGHVTAYAEGKGGVVLEALAEVTDTVPVETVFPPVGGIEFSPDFVTAKPHFRRQLQLWVDTWVIPIGTDIIVRLFGNTTGVSLLTDNDEPVVTRPVRVREADRHATNPRVARVQVPFRGAGYSQVGNVRASVDTAGGQLEATARIEIRAFEPPPGAGIFSDLDYDDRSRSRYACVFEKGSGKLVANSAHPVNARVFGRSFEEFNRAIETDPTAQMRIAELVLDECIYHIAATKYIKGGEYGLDLDSRDPITAIRNFIEETKSRIGLKIFRHFVSSM